MSTVFDILLLDTMAEVHAWALPNIKGEGRERWIGTRDLHRLETFAARRDETGYGVFFCVATIAPGMPRKKEHMRELPWLFADVDFKDHDTPPDDIEAVLRALPCPPSRMHHTGNGIHCFWLLDAPYFSDQMETAEELLRRLAAVLGGDPSVAHCVALMRVPGTHNTKRGERHRVRVIREGVESYTGGQISAWLASVRDPVLVRRGRETNPFLRVAEEQAFRAPVDVEHRLASMQPGGTGDEGVHATQLSCTASLAAAGVDEDEAAALVLDATMQLAGTGDWNWRQEEKTIREMYRDAAKKFERRPERDPGRNPDRPEPRDIGRALAPLVQAPLPAGVVNLAEARKERERDEPDDTPVMDRATAKERATAKLSAKKKNEHVVLGMGILEALRDEGKAIMYAENQCWMYSATAANQGLWKAMTPDEEKSWASVMVERGCNAHRLVSTTKIVNETRAWLQRHPDLHRQDVKWDAHGGVAVRQGILNWGNGEVLPYKAEYHVTKRIDCTYAPEARAPTWQRMLAEDYQFTEGTITFLQELLGVSLLAKKPRGLTRALVLLGPSNTGKSNILNAFAGLLGKEQNSTPLQTLENAHGLMSFLQPVPWVLHEAFDQSRWEMSATAKALLSGDIVHVNVKNGPMLSVEFKQPVFWGTNVPPQFREASRAMENRLAIVKMKRAFNPLRVTGTAAEAITAGYRNPAELVLETERAGLLNWALTGLRRAMARGHFVFTPEMMQSLHTMRTDSNMATGFMEECCEFASDGYVDTTDFYGAFTVWHRDHRGGQTPSADALGRAMHNLSDPRLLVGERVNRKRIYAGIKMNEEGLDCWNAHSSSVAAERSGMRISDRDTDVNKTLGEEQLQRHEFAAMQDAHRSWRPDGAE